MRTSWQWSRAAANCQSFLGPWLSEHQAADAGPEDLVFPGPRFPQRPYLKGYIEGHWKRISARLGLTLTWYQATRHSFVSRLLAAGPRSTK